jgi:hypothetical protein
MERCEREIGHGTDSHDHQRYTDTQTVGQNNNVRTESEMTVEYDFVQNSNLVPITSDDNDNMYDNNSQTGDDMYYEMSPDNEEQETSASTDVTALRVSTNPLPEYLEGIYDTPVASIVHENSLKKSAKISSEATSQHYHEKLDSHENLNEIPYEQMESLQNGEDNYREMSGI